jgi:hypothetical protein
MAAGSDPRERWRFAGRYYLLTLASSPETMDLELDDVGPSLGRGPTLYASCNDATGAMTIRALTSDPLPIELLDEFLSEARLTLPRRGHR